MIDKSSKFLKKSDILCEYLHSMESQFYCPLYVSVIDK